jgi:hypothetical protein
MNEGGIGSKSGGEAFVTVMQAADLRDSEHSHPAWHDRAGVWGNPCRVKDVCGALVVVDVRGQKTAQMVLVDVILTLAANRTDHAHDVRVVPG